MKALTIIEPWATLLVMGKKRYETRDWQIVYRGLIAIHSGKKVLTECDYNLGVAECMINSEITPEILKNNRGKIIAVGYLKDIILMSEDFMKEISETEKDLGLWKVGRYAWDIIDIKPLLKPIPVRGMLGLWDVSDEIEQQINQQLKLKL
jgi:hypothetical protein